MGSLGTDTCRLAEVTAENVGNLFLETQCLLVIQHITSVQSHLTKGRIVAGRSKPEIVLVRALVVLIHKNQSPLLYEQPLRSYKLIPVTAVHRRGFLARVRGGLYRCAKWLELAQ